MKIKKRTDEQLMKSIKFLNIISWICFGVLVIFLIRFMLFRYVDDTIFMFLYFGLIIYLDLRVDHMKLALEIREHKKEVGNDGRKH